MKKHIAPLFLALACILLLFACSQAEPAMTASDYLSLGEKYLLELDYEQAVVQFLKVIEIDPMNPRGYTGAAEAYVGLGNTVAAIEILNQGLDALPYNIDIQEKLNLLLSLQTDPALQNETDPVTVSDDNIEEADVLSDMVTLNLANEELSLLTKLEDALFSYDYDSVYSIHQASEFLDLFTKYSLDDNYNIYKIENDLVFCLSLMSTNYVGYNDGEDYEAARYQLDVIQLNNYIDNVYYPIIRSEMVNELNDFNIHYTTVVDNEANGEYRWINYAPLKNPEQGWIYVIGNALNGFKHGTEEYVDDRGTDIRQYDNGKLLSSTTYSIDGTVTEWDVRENDIDNRP